MTTTLGTPTPAAGFLLALFGQDALRGEPVVYNVLRRSCRAYLGGLWAQAITPRGSRYLRPCVEQVCHLSPPGRFAAHLRVSADGAGLAATLIGLQMLAASAQDRHEPAQARLLNDRHGALLAELMASDHPDRAHILAVLPD